MMTSSLIGSEIERNKQEIMEGLGEQWSQEPLLGHPGDDHYLMKSSLQFMVQNQWYWLAMNESDIDDRDFGAVNGREALPSPYTAVILSHRPESEGLHCFFFADFSTAGTRHIVVFPVLKEFGHPVRLLPITLRLSHVEDGWEAKVFCSSSFANEFGMRPDILESMTDEVMQVFRYMQTIS